MFKTVSSLSLLQSLIFAFKSLISDPLSEENDRVEVYRNDKHKVYLCGGGFGPARFSCLGRVRLGSICVASIHRRRKL